MKDKISPSQLTFRKDFLWYFVGSLIPLAIGFVKTPIFTRHFDKESFGELGLVTITFSFFGMFFFSWINSCLWRYYNKYQELDNLKLLFSNLIFLFFCSLLLVGLFSTIWFWKATNNEIKELVSYSFLQLVFNQYLLGYMVVIRLKGRSAFYNVFQGLRAVLSLLVAVILVFYFKQDIISLVSSLVIVDMFSAIFLSFCNPASLKLDFSMVDKKILIKLLQYGSVGLILNLSFLSISYADRYIIAMYHSIEDVGVYDQVAKISQLSIMALITVFFNTINPTLLKKLESDFKNSIGHVQKYIFSFVFFGIPLVFYCCLFSEDIGKILLGQTFREGAYLMPFIFIATFIHGLSTFFELRLKFSDKLKRLGLVALLTAILNIVLNLMFVGNFGYGWAAYSTLISYLFMILILFWSDRAVLKIFWLKRMFMVKIIVALAIQYLLYLILVENFNLPIIIRIMIGILFAALHLLVFRSHMKKLEMPLTE